MSLPPYPSYSNSGVAELGNVPAHWEVKPLKHIAEIDSCGCYGVDAEAGECALPVATTAQIDSNGHFVVHDMPMRGFTPAEIERYGCGEGDILVVKSSGSATNIISGKAGFVTKDTPPFVFSNFLMRIRPTSGVSNPRFIYSLLRSHLTRQRVEQMCSTTTYPNLKVGEYTSASLPVPPVAEQDVIATFLDRETAKIDALVAEQRRLIDLLKEKRQAIISHAVTKGLNPHAPMKPSAVEWLGDVPAHWEMRRLKHLSREITVGIVVEPSKYYEAEGVPALRSLNIAPGAVTLDNLVFISAEANELHAKSKLNAGDLVAVRSGQPGTTAVIPAELDGCNCIDLIIIRKPSVGTEWFLCWYLASDVAVRQFAIGSGGAIQQHFNVSSAMDLVVPVPPAEEQLFIVAFINAESARLDTLTAEAQRAIALLQERRTALISAAVTGKIDVRGLVETEAA